MLIFPAQYTHAMEVAVHRDLQAKHGVFFSRDASCTRITFGYNGFAVFVNEPVKDAKILDLIVACKRVLLPIYGSYGEQKLEILDSKKPRELLKMFETLSPTPHPIETMSEEKFSAILNSVAEKTKIPKRGPLSKKKAKRNPVPFDMTPVLSELETIDNPMEKMHQEALTSLNEIYPELQEIRAESARYAREVLRPAGALFKDFAIQKRTKISPLGGWSLTYNNPTRVDKWVDAVFCPEISRQAIIYFAEDLSGHPKNNFCVSSTQFKKMSVTSVFALSCIRSIFDKEHIIMNFQKDKIQTSK